MPELELVEKIARIYAKNDGHDPDEDHGSYNYSKPYEEDKQIKYPFEKSGQKKWEFYIGRAKSSIEIFEILKEAYK